MVNSVFPASRLILVLILWLQVSIQVLPSSSSPIINTTAITTTWTWPNDQFLLYTMHTFLPHTQSYVMPQRRRRKKSIPLNVRLDLADMECQHKSSIFNSPSPEALICRISTSDPKYNRPNLVLTRPKGIQRTKWGIVFFAVPFCCPPAAESL